MPKTDLKSKTPDELETMLSNYQKEGNEFKVSKVYGTIRKTFKNKVCEKRNS